MRATLAGFHRVSIRSFSPTVITAFFQRRKTSSSGCKCQHHLYRKFAGMNKAVIMPGMCLFGQLFLTFQPVGRTECSRQVYGAFRCSCDGSISKSFFRRHSEVIMLNTTKKICCILLLRAFKSWMYNINWI